MGQKMKFLSGMGDKWGRREWENAWIIHFHWENNEGSMHLSGAGVLTAPLRFHLLSAALSIPLHVEHVNRFAHS